MGLIGLENAGVVDKSKVVANPSANRTRLSVNFDDVTNAKPALFLHLHFLIICSLHGFFWGGWSGKAKSAYKIIIAFLKVAVIVIIVALVMVS